MNEVIIREEVREMRRGKRVNLSLMDQKRTSRLDFSDKSMCPAD